MHIIKSLKSISIFFNQPLRKVEPNQPLRKVEPNQPLRKVEPNIVEVEVTVIILT